MVENIDSPKNAPLIAMPARRVYKPRAAAQPGYVPIYAQVLKRDGSRVPWKTATVDELIDSYCIFVGTPDKVHAQIKEFYDYVGGCDHILMMGQGGNLDHASTMDNHRLFSREVLPQVRELSNMAIALPHHNLVRQMS